MQWLVNHRTIRLTEENSGGKDGGIAGCGVAARGRVPGCRLLAAGRVRAAAVRPGISAKEVDQVCRQIIAEAGWAERFEHGTGHGVGLDIHEAPTVSQLGTAILAPGFVVTVEPGVYVPGHGGVRVEDTLVVTEDGARPLTRFTKDIHGSLDQ